MGRLTGYTSWADALSQFSTAELWDLFDGDRDRLNIAHECIDRHAGDPDRIAVRIAHEDGRDEFLSFDDLAAWSSRFANWLTARGVEPGDRVAVMLEPSLGFYAGMFGCMKAGAVAVPMFTLFGPEGARLRLDDSAPKLLLTSREKADALGAIDGIETVVPDDAFLDRLAGYSDVCDFATGANDMAAYQYTSGTTRELPEAIRHTHRAIVLVTIAALYGTGIRPGDEFFCPSSPAWGHGLWHGTLAPLAMGVTTGVYAGRFDADRLMRALQDYGVTNLSAAATHYRMMKNAGTADRYRFRLEKLSFTGEPIDEETAAFAERTFGHRVCSMYGTTEVGVILVNYPGAKDFDVRPGSLGKPVPNMEVEIQRSDGSRAAPGEIGEIMLKRRDTWVPTKDLGHTDEDGYFYHDGRADDVIISAGWTMSAVEIENALLAHPDIREAAAIGVADETRGQVVKAFLVTPRANDEVFRREVQDFVRNRLSQHEYPRQIAVVSELPKTPAGKVNRKFLRDREQQQAAASQ
ncbi:MAG: acyl-CoA synthetase [Minwuia sp.]|uniref:acyl-CoA synthetase n=1 Tax=Minwuia sp. TaxID=2493630 RepID=UPI003A85CBB4